MKNSGSEVDASARPDIVLSTGPLRWRSASRPRMTASGTETIVAQKARRACSRAAAERGGDFLAARHCRAEIARQDVAESPEIANVGRVVEAELLAKIGERLRRRRPSKDRLCKRRRAGSGCRRKSELKRKRRRRPALYAGRSVSQWATSGAALIRPSASISQTRSRRPSARPARRYSRRPCRRWRR